MMALHAGRVLLGLRVSCAEMEHVSTFVSCLLKPPGCMGLHWKDCNPSYPPQTLSLGVVAGESAHSCNTSIRIKCQHVKPLGDMHTISLLL